MAFILYRREHCDLCEMAEAILLRENFDFESAWIDGDDALELRYGERVPVLHQADTTRELNWPFDNVAVRAFCNVV